jgi:hypothetical protein
MTTGVPQSCTLPTAEQPLRVAELDALFAERLLGSSRPDRLRLELALTGGEVVEETRPCRGEPPCRTLLLPPASTAPRRHSGAWPPEV